MRKRLAIVASHVIQYQDPFFRLLAADGTIDLTVLFCSRAGAVVYHDQEMKTALRWDIELLTGYRHEFLRNHGFGSGYTRLINPSIIWKIGSLRYDAVLFFPGWGTITSLIGIAACRATGTPFLLYGDSSHPPSASGVKGRLREAFLRAIFRLADGFMVSGVLNAAYYQHYGADPSRFHLLPWAVDNDRFVRGSIFAPGERDALRSRLGLRADEIACVFSAKLIPRKDPLTLVRAVAAARNRDRLAVVFLGDGSMRSETEAAARAAGVHAIFAGFVNQADLPKHYAAGDVFVLPSIYEPRGAVINEAMACGLPVVVTDRCGSIGDIVIEGDNSIVYPAGDAEALAAALDRLAEDPQLRASMAARSKEIIATWDFARGVEGVKAAMSGLTS